VTSLASAVREARREIELQQAAAEERELELTEAEKFKRDPVGWLNSGKIWIASRFDTEGNELAGRKLRTVRLKLFPDQVRTVEAWIDLPHLARSGELVFRNAVIEKSRQIGETWLFAALIGWALHYHPVTGLAINWDGAKIDDGGERNTVESLFGRIRYIDHRLDPGKLPGVKGRLVFRPFSRDPAKVENPANGSVCIGEGQTDDPGRGSTFDFVLGDEFAFLRHSERVHAALDEACPDGKAYLSTVNGEGNAHARIAKERPEGWTYLRLHWSSHPVYSQGLHVAGDDPDCELCKGNREKVRWTASAPMAHRYPGKPTSPYYDRRVIGKTDEQVANELDIDRERAKPGRVFPEFRSDVHVVWDGISYEPGLHHMLELAIDYGLDATSVLVLQDLPAELRMIGILECGHLFGTSGTPEAVSAALLDYLRDLGVAERLLTPEFTRTIYGIGDPAGHNRTLETGKPFVAAYRRNGFVFGKPASRLTRRITPSVNALKLLFDDQPKPFRICGLKCEAFVDHARENTWRIGPDGQLLGLNDDIHNHAMRAAGYYAVAKFPPRAEEAMVGPFDEPAPEESPLARRRRRALQGDGDRAFASFDSPL
jgi:hypothetical protein